MVSRLLHKLKKGAVCRIVNGQWVKLHEDVIFKAAIKVKPYTKDRGYLIRQTIRIPTSYIKIVREGDKEYPVVLALKNSFDKAHGQV